MKGNTKAALFGEVVTVVLIHKHSGSIPNVSVLRKVKIYRRIGRVLIAWIIIACASSQKSMAS